MIPSAVHAGRNYIGQQQVKPNWSTRRTQHDAPVTTEDLLLGCCCIPCAAAYSKGIADKTNPFFNFCCFTPCGSYSWVRHQYGIEGVCGDDLGYGIFCACCNARQATTEARLRGPAPNAGTYGANSAEWAHSLFDCSLGDFCNIIFCAPCAVHSVRVGLQPGAESCCFDFMCIPPCAMYGQVRHSYGIVSDFGIVEDMCLPIVCYLCAFNRARKQVMSVPLNAGGLPSVTGFLPAPGGYRPF